MDLIHNFYYIHGPWGDKINFCGFSCVIYRACERSVSGAWAKGKTERSESKIGWSGALSGRGRKRWSGSESRSGRSRSGNRAESGLNRSLTARSNLTVHWLHKVHSLHTTVCSLLFSLHSLVLLLFQTRPNRNLTQPKVFLFLSKTQSIWLSTWCVLAKCAFWTCRLMLIIVKLK